MFFSAFVWIFRKKVVLFKLLHTQPRGVMVAQVVLVHSVEVQVLAGLPFFIFHFFLIAQHCFAVFSWSLS